MVLHCGLARAGRRSRISPPGALRRVAEALPATLTGAEAMRIYRKGCRMNDKEPIKLRLPRQDLSEFALFGLSADQARNWAEGLSMVDAAQLARRLHGAVGDLNRVDVDPDIRFEILEALRPALHTALSTLSRRYLDQPAVLPEESREARLARNLYALLTTAYTIAGVRTIRRHRSIPGANPARLVCRSLHRAITSAGMKLLVACQLYRPAELNAWNELHQLFLLAERQKLTSQTVVDEIAGDGSIADTYLRALTMGCCKPNQLRPHDLAGVYRGLRDWVRHIELLPAEGGEGLFLVDFAGDRPPTYASLHGKIPGAGCRIVNTEKLVSHLKRLRADTGERTLVFDRDTAVSPNVLDHLIAAWGVMSKRNFARAPARERLWVSAGLNNTHYYASGGIGFEDPVSADGARAPSRAGRADGFPGAEGPREKDIWEGAFSAAAEGEEAVDREDIEFHIREAGQPGDTAAGERHPVYPVRMVDVGPGGYCLEWSPLIPSHIRTGDVIAARAVDGDAWNIAVIRWVNQLRDRTTLFGVELLSPRATPCGARVRHKTGEDGDPMRALLLPEIKLVGQPDTLITPRVGFRERQKVTLIRGGEESCIQLFRKVSSTAACNRFEFRYIQQLDEVAARAGSGVIDSEFESVWSKL